MRFMKNIKYRFFLCFIYPYATMEIDNILSAKTPCEKRNLFKDVLYRSIQEVINEGIKCRSIAVEIKNCVSDMLSEYLNP